METARLKLSAIIADEKFNARKTYDPEAIENIAKDIKKNGQLNPVLVVVHPNKPGKYSLISGFTRYKAFQKIEDETKEEPTVFAQITDTADRLDQFLLNLGENIQRRELSTYDIANRVTEISEEFELSAPAIGARVGLGGKHVSNYMRIIKNVRPEILEEWKNGHAQATTMKLTKLAAMEPEDQLTHWNVLCGIEPDGEGEEDGDDDSGTGRGEGADKKRRPSEAMLAAAIVAAQEADIDDATKKGVVMALKFALGKSKTIPNVFNPAKQSSKRNSNGEAEAQA